MPRGPKLVKPPKESTTTIVSFSLDKTLVTRLTDFAVRAGESRSRLVGRWVLVGIECEETRLRNIESMTKQFADSYRAKSDGLPPLFEVVPRAEAKERREDMDTRAKGRKNAASRRRGA